MSVRSHHSFSIVRLKSICGLLVLSCWLVLNSSAQAQQQTETVPVQIANPKLEKMLKQLDASKKAVKAAKDYTATFQKTERLNDGRLVSQTLELKHRTEPFSVYLFFRGGDSNGQQVLYSQGWNNNQLMVKPTGIAALIGTVSLAPTSSTAMKDSRHPVTEIGFAGLLDGVIKMWQDDLKYADLEVGFYKDAKLNSNDPNSYYAFRTYHPQPRQAPRFQETRLYLDKKTLLPIHLENRAFPPQQGGQQILVEKYTYSNIKLNVGLNNSTFNPQTYGF